MIDLRSTAAGIPSPDLLTELSEAVGRFVDPDQFRVGYGAQPSGTRMLARPRPGLA